MAPDISRWLLAFTAASIVGLVAHRRRSLSVNGMLAAIATGTLLVGTAGWWAGLLLVTFFVSSSVLSRNDTGHQARGAERDAVQVLANGGVALLAGIAFAFTTSSGWIAVLAGSIAAAASDTWSTEIGRTSRSQPRLITTGRTAQAGTSGAVSGKGLVGALLAATLIGFLASFGWQLGALPGSIAPLSGFLAVTIGGVAGSLLDSLLGATVQNQRWCDMCSTRTEQRVHRCGTATRSVRGASWIDNDVVNVCCVITGGVVSWSIVSLMN